MSKPREFSLVETHTIRSKVDPWQTQITQVKTGSENKKKQKEKNNNNKTKQNKTNRRKKYPAAVISWLFPLLQRWRNRGCLSARWAQGKKKTYCACVIATWRLAWDQVPQLRKRRKKSASEASRAVALLSVQLGSRRSPNIFFCLPFHSVFYHIFPREIRTLGVRASLVACRKKGSFLVINKWGNRDWKDNERYPHRNTKANQQWFPQQ